MKEFLILLAVLMCIPLVFATPILDYLQVPSTVTIGEVKTTLHAKIENQGVEKVFIALPSDWTFEPEDIFTNHASGYRVLDYGIPFYELYGYPTEPNNMVSRGEVYIYSGFATKRSYTVNNRVGWWLMPNEGMILDIAATLPVSGKHYDPFELERGPDIVIKEWYQRFTVNLTGGVGFVTAPYIIENMALVEANPGIYGDARYISTSVYYEDFQLGGTIDVVEWNEWFGPRSVFKRSLTSISLGAEYLPIEEEGAPEYIIPVWKIDPGTASKKEIYYAYEWKYWTDIKGVSLGTSTFIEVPNWYEWF